MLCILCHKMSSYLLVDKTLKSSSLYRIILVNKLSYNCRQLFSNQFETISKLYGWSSLSFKQLNKFNNRIMLIRRLLSSMAFAWVIAND